VPTPAPAPAPPPGSTRVTRFTGQPARGGDDEAEETAPPVRRARPGAGRIGEEDSVLASIVSGITIPDSEREAIDVVEEIPAPTPPPPPKAEPRPEPKPVKVAAASPSATSGKTTAKPTAKADTKKTPAKPDPKKADPARIWVQVAGGANEKTLPATWQKLVKQAPAAFKGKSGWTTPLRATNRLLAGPFKSDKDAQGFVNALRKEDISAFVFTSEAGQKITKLGAK
jgi:hypothetical protein